jgi:serine phosphatase RsbU (regulator of sigma subunit)
MLVIRAVAAPNRSIGLSGVVPAMIALAAALYGGRWVGVVVGLVSSTAYVFLIAFHSPPDPLLYGVPIVVVWTAGAFVAGVIADELRRRVFDATFLVEAERDRMTEMASMLQTALLPPALPSVPGIELSVFFRPAGDGTELGGDFYDAWAAPDGSFGFLIGDVCGKGAAAAAITALSRHTIRTALILGTTPREALIALNDGLLRRTTRERFVTAVCGRGVRTTDGYEFRVASGGHPLPILVGGDGRAKEFGAHGTLLGVFPAVELEETVGTVGIGESLVCYTDGVTDVRRAGELFGEERLLTLLREQAGRSPREVCDAVRTATSDFALEPPPDDAAILVIQIVAGTLRAVAPLPSR